MFQIRLNPLTSVCIRLLLVYFLFVASTCAFEVRLSSDTIYPGDTIGIILDGTKKKGGYLVWFNARQYPLYRIGKGRLRTLIGLSCDFTPGDYSLLVVGTEKKRKLITKSIKLKIKEKKYPSREINFSPEKKGLIYSPENAKERRLIREALGTESSEQYWEGLFLKPVDGEVISEYGVRRMMGGEFLWSHKGVDLRGGIGKEIISPNKGMVTLVSDDFFLQGGTIVIDHGRGVSSVYYHLNKIYVKEGNWVEKDSLIGEVGDTGLTTGPHLHWGISVHGIPVTPLQWLEDWVPE